MADDQEQRNFEIVKLRIAFLQHITTLSGAAILIVLALIQRAEAAWGAFQLATTISLFVLAALVSVTGVVFLIMFAEEPASHVPDYAGRTTTSFAGAAFSAGIICVASSAIGVPIPFFAELVSMVAVILLAGFTVLLSLTHTRRSRGGRS